MSSCLPEALQLFSIAEVAAVSESWHDILVLIHTRVDGSAPNGRALWQCLLYDLDALRCGYHATQMDLLRLARLHQRIDGDLSLFVLSLVPYPNGSTVTTL